MKKIKYGIVGLLLVATVSLTPASPATAAEPLISVLPSGCIRISILMELNDPYPWWEYNTIYSYYDPARGWMRQITYKIKPAPQSNEFVGATHWPGHSYWYNAPVGANQVDRAINCMLSNGGSQG